MVLKLKDQTLRDILKAIHIRTGVVYERLGDQLIIVRSPDGTAAYEKNNDSVNGVAVKQETSPDAGADGKIEKNGRPANPHDSTAGADARQSTLESGGKKEWLDDGFQEFDEKKKPEVITMLESLYEKHIPPTRIKPSKRLAGPDDPGVIGIGEKPEGLIRIEAQNRQSKHRTHNKLLSSRELQDFMWTYMLSESRRKQQQKKRKKLAKLIIPELEFREVSVNDALQFLGEISGEYGLPVFVYDLPETQGHHMITLFKARDVSLLNALQSVTQTSALDFYVTDNVVLIYPKKKSAKSRKL